MTEHAHIDPHPTRYDPAEWTGPDGRTPQPYPPDGRTPQPYPLPDWTPLACLLAVMLLIVLAT